MDTITIILTSMLTLQGRWRERVVLKVTFRTEIYVIDIVITKYTFKIKYTILSLRIKSEKRRNFRHYTIILYCSYLVHCRLQPPITFLYSYNSFNYTHDWWISCVQYSMLQILSDMKNILTGVVLQLLTTINKWTKSRRVKYCSLLR